MSRFAVLISVIVVTLLLAAVASTTFAADSDIVISEVGYNATCQGATDSTCGATGGETHFEWVEIYNRGTATVNISSWRVCDGSSCDPLPNQDIGPGEYWIIAHNTAALQTEFNQYSPSYSVDANRTISLNGPIGSGLNNSTGDVVYLLNSSSSTVDCVSWDSTVGTACDSRTYVPGGDGLDTDLNNAQNGQSIANIQGGWYEHGPNDASEQASPYQPNTAAGGSPTVINLSVFAAQSGLTARLSGHGRVARFYGETVALVAGGFALVMAGLIILKRRRPH